MPISARVASTLPSRPCAFCLGLQDDSVFADFDVDGEGRAFLRRISFDGYGCYHGDFQKMPADDSRTLLASLERSSIAGPEIESLLRTYFQANADEIGRDALMTHGLL